MFRNAPGVDYDHNERQWMVSRGNREVLFDKLAMAVAFGDPLRVDYEDSAIAVVGRQTDKTLCILFVVPGEWRDIKRFIVDVKDRFYTKVCCVPEEPERLVDELRRIEGLTHYKEEPIPGSRTNRKRPVTPTETWPEFRNHDHRCSLAFVDQEQIKDLKTSAIKLDEMGKDGKITVWPGCLFTAIAMQEGEMLRESLNDARLQAVLFAMEYVMPRVGSSYEDHQPPVWYKM